MSATEEFKDQKLTGPYQVGLKEFRIAAGNKVSVIYPVDQDEYDSVITTSNAFWLRYGENSVKGLFGRIGSSLPTFLLGGWINKKCDIAEDAELSSDFSGEEKSLIPILWSHGNGSARYLYTGIAREFASRGYIVFAIDHNDGSNLFYETSDNGDGVVYNLNNGFNMQTRFDEQQALLDEVVDPTLMQDLFGVNIALIDDEKVVSAGHSLGGGTAVGHASQDSRVKAILTLDPFFNEYMWELIQNGTLTTNVPQQINFSSEYYDENIFFYDPNVFYRDTVNG